MTFICLLRVHVKRNYSHRMVCPLKPLSTLVWHTFFITNNFEDIQVDRFVDGSLSVYIYTYIYSVSPYYLKYFWRWCTMLRAVPSADPWAQRLSSYWRYNCPRCWGRPGSRWWSPKDRSVPAPPSPAACTGALACLCGYKPACPICSVRRPRTATTLSSVRHTSFCIRTLRNLSYVNRKWIER